MQAIVKISQLSKTYQTGHQALRQIDLEIYDGEILALLGPNGAGKTTLISVICGIVAASTGSVTVAGHDIATDNPILSGSKNAINRVLYQLMFATRIKTVDRTMNRPIHCNFCF